MENRKIEDFLKEIYIDFLKEGKAIWAQTQGRSMEPVIREGDFVKIIPVRIEELKRADIVAFLKNEREKIIIAHRLIKKDKNNLITCGDNFIFGIDPPLDKKEILGKVIALRRNKKEINLERGIRYFYGKVITHLRIYSLPLLVLFLITYKFFTQPKLFFVQAIRKLRSIIKVNESYRV